MKHFALGMILGVILWELCITDQGSVGVIVILFACYYVVRKIKEA